MLARYEHGGLVWIDLENPTRDEVQRVMEEFGLSHFVAEELLLPTMKPRVEFHERYLYTILHFPALRHTHKTPEQEVDFVVGDKFLITTHYDTIDPLHKFSRAFEVNSVIDKSGFGEHAGYLFFYMVRRLYKAVESEVDCIRSDLHDIEKHLFSDREVEIVRSISRTARDVLNVRQTIEPHRDILKALEADGAKFFGEEFVPFLRSLGNDYYRLHNHIMRLTEALHEVRETNNSLLTTKEGETMRVLTTMALLTFPLVLILDVLRIESDYNPLYGMKYDFWMLLGVVIVVAGGMLWYFKHKKWL